jgi:crotonobetainyl-CoA:carnitine CoA-transferase CaiB-like acyl-CoA transferase
MAGALEGLRVIDMTSVVMGPTATQLLGDYGADIIKVEAPTGDTARQVTPLKHEGMGYSYLTKNRNKRSIVLDLKQAEHHAALEKLLETADIFVYSARPQAMARRGLTPTRFAELNPGLISVSLVGYGEGGPYTGRPAYEDLIQGLTSVPSLLTRAGSPQPQYVPLSFNDRGVGIYAAALMMIALHHRDRTGEGQHLEVPMFETMASSSSVTTRAAWPGSRRSPLLATCGPSRRNAGRTRPRTASSASSSTPTASGARSARSSAARAYLRRTNDSTHSARAPRTRPTSRPPRCTPWSRSSTTRTCGRPGSSRNTTTVEILTEIGYSEQEAHAIAGGQD